MILTLKIHRYPILSHHSLRKIKNSVTGITSYYTSLSKALFYWKLTFGSNLQLKPTFTLLASAEQFGQYSVLSPLSLRWLHTKYTLVPLWDIKVLPVLTCIYDTCRFPMSIRRNLSPSTHHKTVFFCIIFIIILFIFIFTSTVRFIIC